MIDNPSNQTEHIRNLTERVATECKALRNRMDTYVKSVNGASPDASGNALVDVGVKTINSSKPDANGNIKLEAVTNADFATKAEKDVEGKSFVDAYATKDYVILGMTLKADLAHTHDDATNSYSGFMSPDEKKKLAGIEASANKYTHPSHTAKTNGFYKVTVDSQGHVSGTAAVTKSDITALGIPAQDTTYTLSSFGVTATATELNKLDGATVSTTELNYVKGVTSSIQTQLNNKLASDGTAVKATADASGNNIVNTYATKTALSEGLATKSGTGHSHDEVTQSAKGFMSAADKKKLDGIAEGANNYVLPPTLPGVLGGVKVGSNITLKEGEISLSFDDVVNALGWIPLKTVNSHEADIHGNVDVSAGFFETDGIKSAIVTDNRHVYVPPGGQWFCFGTLTKTVDGLDGDYSEEKYYCTTGLYAGGTKLFSTADKYGVTNNNIVCFRNADGEWE